MANVPTGTRLRPVWDSERETSLHAAEKKIEKRYVVNPSVIIRYNLSCTPISNHYINRADLFNIPLHEPYFKFFDWGTLCLKRCFAYIKHSG
jgi:DICT domain-containing protein